MTLATTLHPVVERTRLRFPELAREGWVYLTNTFWSAQGGRPSEVELYARHGQPFAPQAVCIRPDLPGFGLAELAHVVLPGVAPVFVRTGRQDLRQALQADFATDAWRQTTDTYRDYFAAVTAQRYADLAEQGWLWVLDLRLCPGQAQPDPDEAGRVLRHCLGLDYLQPADACLRGDLARPAWQSSGGSLCVPVFVQPAQPVQTLRAAQAACLCMS